MYNDCFGFSEPPFNMVPNPRFFFQNRSYDEVISIVEHGVATRKGIIVVTGEPGTGKTLLVKLLASKLEPKIKTVVVQDPDITLKGLLRLLLDRIVGFSTIDENTVTIDSLRERLIEQRENGQALCLFIDEAQDLNDETLDDLRLLSNLDYENEALLPIILMGQPELEAKLDRPSAQRIKQRVALTRKIYPLIRREIVSYVAHRLQIARYNGQELFVPEAIEMVANISKGIPRTINVICDNALMKAYKLNESTVSPGIIDQVAYELRLSPRAPLETNNFNRNTDPQSRISDTFSANGDSIGKHPPPSSIEKPLVDLVEVADNKFPTLGRKNSDFATLQQLVTPEDLEEFPDDDPPAVPDGDPSLKGVPPSKDGGAAPPRFAPGRTVQRAFSAFRSRWIAIVVAAVSLMFGIGGLLYRWQSPEFNLAASIAPHPPPADSSLPSSEKARAKGNDEFNGSFVALAVPEPVTLNAEQGETEEFPPIDPKNGRSSAPHDANGAKQLSTDAAHSPHPGNVNSRSDPRLALSEAPTIQTPIEKAPEPRQPQTAEPRSKEKDYLPASTQKATGTSYPTLVVVGASMVRDKPSHKARIIGNLAPGTRVRLIAKSRDYYHVISMEKKSLRGYVHREDAFFKQKK